MPYASFWERLGYSLQIWSVQSFEEFSDNDAIEKEFVDFQGNRNSQIEKRNLRPASKVSGAFVITEAYRFLMVVAALLVSLAHGSNDVANAITPLLVVQTANDNPDSKAGYWVGSLGIAAGLLTLGYMVMETVGKKVLKLNFVKGFCAQFATAVSVICGSLLGLPLSTTQCMVGSLLGIVLAEKLSFVRFAYVTSTQKNDVIDFLNNQDSVKYKDVPDQVLKGLTAQNSDTNSNKLLSEDDLASGEPITNDEVTTEPRRQSVFEDLADKRIPAGSVLSSGENSGKTGLNGKLFGKIVFWWLITVPVAFGASYLLELLIETV